MSDEVRAHNSMMGLERAKRAREAEMAEAKRDPVFRHLIAVFVNAKKNARAKGRGQDAMTERDLLMIYRKAGGRCQLTGVPFDCTRPKGSGRAPFAPSLDRIDNAKGYVAGNVRLVCQIANLAMNVWGPAVLLDFIARSQTTADELADRL